MAEFESLFFSTWDDFPWNGPKMVINVASLDILLLTFSPKIDNWDLVSTSL